ncbi:hypothetical protein SDC9_139357 [bioreactor metagenome]|uniref:NAD-specific glutamate dehydrogenase n=1 Tax=bioreactor metagenome TaxID=1076179 RepID=A0A645DV53_9ZZZZ
MADGDGGAGVDQQHRHRLADDVGTADDHGFLASQINIALLEHLHDAVRGTRDETRCTLRQGANVLGMEAVDILLGGDGFEHFLFVEMLRQRQLDQDAVNGRIGIQFGDLVEHHLLVDIAVIDDLFGMHADGQAAIDLVLHINLGGRVFADQNNHQTGLVPLGRQRLNAGLEALAQFVCQRLAVDNLCRHRRIQQKENGKGNCLSL